MSEETAQVSQSRKGKHVIILGAGASRSSGYPMAEGLRKILGERRGWVDYVKRTRVYERDHNLGQTLESCWNWPGVKDARRLFREGGFATVDEFCKLVRKGRPDLVRPTKAVMAVALAMHNPESKFFVPDSGTDKSKTGFANSDYYAFVQRLFDHEKLHNLRQDVVVMTFNYDPHLDFLLLRAYQRRKEAAGLPWRKEREVLDDLTSGFYARTALGGQGGFCLLKLHGTIAVPIRRKDRKYLTYTDIFAGPGRLQAKLVRKGLDAPVVFPWELDDLVGTGTSCDNQHRSMETEALRTKGLGSSKGLAAIFRGIWERARGEIAWATKVSFVGLSMHPYLRDSFRRLFELRKMHIERDPKSPFNKLEIVSASPGSVDQDNGNQPNDGRSRLCASILGMLNGDKEGICPSLKVYSSRNGDNALTVYPDFRVFIENEMIP